MRYLLSLVLGFAASGIGVIPPGLLNMTALRISISEGKSAAKVFVAGAILVISVECYLAVLFARYLGKHPEVVLMLREAALVVFMSLAIYFFFWAKKMKPEKEKIKLPSRSRRFFLGMLFSGLNFLTVPFYVVVSLAFNSYRIFDFTQLHILLFVVGVILGTGFGFYCFVTFFQRMQKYTSRVIHNMNYVIGSVLLLISILTAINIIQYYYG
ncbi:LysE family transporter [Flavobacterium silvaticum]|uniref:LysE family transporter n=1 Tax=Flavobacterium silvaticum TaxID=1852020 RepID=A0A972FU45_9FLAO|nr:LysE family transporter [Flavobacterium silvaticum]NMH28538.1 LysE family transporter [Flavobacterium silvaticum]